MATKNTKLKKYNVNIPYYASVFIDVEAKNREEAVEIAYKKVHAEVYCHCSRHVEICEPMNDEPHVEELDE